MALESTLSLEGFGGTATSEAVQRKTKEGVQLITPEDLQQLEYSQIFRASADAILTTLSPVTEALDATKAADIPQTLATQIARNAALTVLATEKSASLRRTLGIPAYVEFIPQAAGMDPEVRGKVIVWQKELSNFVSSVAIGMEEKRQDLQPDLVAERASNALSTLCGDVPAVKKVTIDINSKKAFAEQVNVLGSEGNDSLREDTVQVLTAVLVERFTEVCRRDKALGVEVTHILEPALDNPGAYANRLMRLAELIQAKMPVSTDSAVVVSKRFDEAVQTTPGIEKFHQLFAKDAFRGQVDVLTWALDGFDENNESSEDVRVRNTRSFASKLASEMGISVESLKNAVKAWEKQTANLFKSQRDAEIYAGLSIREKATIVALSLNNGLKTQEKVRQILQEPGALTVIQQCLTPSDNGARFSGWLEASLIAALVGNTAGKVIEKRMPGMRRSAGGPGREPQNHHVPEKVMLTLILGSLILAACSPKPTDSLTSTATTGHTVNPPLSTFTPEVTATLAATPPSPQPTTIAGSPDSTLLALAGLPAGAGGTADMASFTNSAPIQSIINAEGYAPIYYHDETNNTNVLSWTTNGVCWFNAPQQIFDSNYNPEILSTFVEGIAHYTPDTANGVPLDAFTKVDISGLPAGYSCLGAIMNKPGDPNYTALEVLLYNTNTNELVGWMPIVYAHSANLHFVQSSDGHFGIKVGAKTLNWLAMNSETQTMPTPEVLRPTVDSNLLPQNNATTVLENGTWVVKNSAGNVTATWDGTTNKWTYNYENIQMQVGIAEPKFVLGWPDTIREGITVTVPDDMLKPLSSAQLDPNPLVPSGYYGDFEQTTQKGIITEAEIGVDYRGIILIDKDNSVEGKQTEQYVVVFTVQYKDHPDVINTLLVPINNTNTNGLYIDLFPAGSTDPGTKQPGPNNDDFISMLKAKNPIGRRMSIFVYASDTAGEKSLLYSPDHATLVNAITNGQPIPSGLNLRLWSHFIRMPHDLR